MRISTFVHIPEPQPRAYMYISECHCSVCVFFSKNVMMPTRMMPIWQNEFAKMVFCQNIVLPNWRAARLAGRRPWKQTAKSNLAPSRRLPSSIAIKILQPPNWHHRVSRQIGSHPISRENGSHRNSEAIADH